MPNALATAVSPYLLQHKDNPVDWREWGQDALAEARARDVPIVLSVGYAACHWCHVMAHESFEDEASAAQMNRDFVAIKVDREERPDIDAIYQQALALLGQQGGWPLTMFLTPEAEPFWGGTYFPNEPRYGRASFPQILEQISRLWREERSKLDGNRAQLKAALAELARPEAGGPVDPANALAVAHAMAQQFDTIHGGLGGAPKFPQAPLLDLLWRAATLAGDRLIEARLLHTLRRICQGGIYDHLGGGFARYSVDAFWLVPHFEKMLYDNAQLLRLLARAWAISRDPLFARRMDETVAWLGREMLVEGAFASALDADSEGEEGKFYVWDQGEIRALLGDDSPAFELAYGVTGPGNFEGRNVLNRLHEPGLPPPGEDEMLARCRATLLQARATRVRPGRDDKVLADWNGLMIAGLVEAATVLHRPAWLELAAGAFCSVTRHMSEGDRLFHSWRAGQRLPQAFLDDYAQMAAAAVALFETQGGGQYLERAQAWVAVADREFKDRAGSYFQTAQGEDALLVRPRAAHDGPTPSGNATLAEVSVRLHHLTGEDAHRRRAEAIFAAFGGEIRSNPGGFGAMLSALLLHHHPVQIVIVGDPVDPATGSLWRAAAEAPVATRIMRTLVPGSSLPEGHPASGKGMVAGRPAAYICVGPACQPPISDAAALVNALARSARATFG